MWKELKDKQIGVFDTETNGLLHNVTEVHCCVISHTKAPKHKDTKEYCLGAQRLYLKALDGFEVIAGHNIIGYDLPLLKKMYNWEPAPHVIILDTLWMSRLFNPDIDGGHSLGMWGKRLGNDKLEYYPVKDKLQPTYNPLEKQPKKNPGWEGSIYTEEMGEYCKQDVNLNVDVFWKLVELLEHFEWRSVECEMKTALIIQRQMEHGFVFNKIEAEKLHAELTTKVIDLEEEVLTTFKPIAKFIREIQPKVRQDGEVSPVGLGQIDRWEEVIPTPDVTRSTKEVTKVIECFPNEEGSWPDDESNKWFKEVTKVEKIVEYHSGAFSLISWPEFSLGSRPQIAERLLASGYKLTKKTEKGNFIVDDEVLREAAEAGVPEAIPLSAYFTIQKMEAMVKNWISNAKWNPKQGVWRIHGYVNSLGAATNRMTHSKPNVAQVPSVNYKDKKILYGFEGGYGYESRSLFTVRSGYKLVGCDASGLELRCLAHYMGDEDYTDTILNGDIHTKNMIAAGLVTRDQAKTFIYAFLYGAGDAKIGNIVGGSLKAGKALKAKFLAGTPALKRLREGILSTVSRRMWLKGIDGRILRVRYQHAALNTLLQGMGAIIMKYWLVEVARVADEEGLDWNPSGNIHDEGQFEVKEEDVPRFKEICEAAFPTVTKLLSVKCLLEGEAQEGLTWATTH